MRVMVRSKIVTLLFVTLSLVVLVGIAGAHSPRPGIMDYADVDFGGKTVTIIIRDIDWVVFNGGKPTDDRVAQAEELFNVKIETGTFSNVDNLMSRIMANDSTFDIFRFNHRSGYFPLASSGMLLPISQYLPEEYFESLPNSDQYTIEKLAFRGDYYGLGVTYGLFNGSMMIMYYNLDVIAEEGLEDPYELWMEGRWTTDEFEKMLIAVTKDTDGDGVIDRHGFRDIAAGTNAYRFIPFNGAEVAKKDAEDKWVYTLDEPDAINAINLINRWRDLGVLGANQVFGSDHLAGFRNRLAAGENLGFVPYPKGPNVDRHQFPVFDFSANFLPVNSAYPEGMMALIDFLFREEDGEEYLDFYVNSYMKTRAHLDVYTAGIEQWRGEGDAFQNSGLWTITDPAVNKALSGEQGVAAAVDEVALSAQAFLDDLFAQ